MTLYQLAEWLEATSLSAWVQGSTYGFAIVVAVHIMSLTLSVGTLVWFDLRLLGRGFRHLPLPHLYRRLMPWTWLGFALMFVSGGILLAAYATSAYGNLYFRVKVVAIVLAGVNALVYHGMIARRLAGHADTAAPAGAARAAGLVSIVLWAVVIVSGRLMSYTMF